MHVLGNVSIEFNLRGVNSAVATACATGGHAIAEAYTFISLRAWRILCSLAVRKRQ